MRCGNRPRFRPRSRQLRDAPFVEYERVAALKLRFLKLAFVQFLREWRRDTPRAREFRAFLEREGDLLETFATYCALDEYLHRARPEVWMWTAVARALPGSRIARNRAPSAKSTGAR